MVISVTVTVKLNHTVPVKDTHMKNSTYPMSMKGAALDDVTSGCFEQQLNDG